MNGAYCNMSVPPRTTMMKDVRPVGRQVVLGLSLAGFQPGDYANLLETFEREHGSALASAPRPQGYVIAVQVRENHVAVQNVPTCRDQALTLAVVSRIAGGLYIPRREPRLTEENARAVFLLPASAFPQLPNSAADAMNCVPPISTSH